MTNCNNEVWKAGGERVVTALTADGQQQYLQAEKLVFYSAKDLRQCVCVGVYMCVWTL